MLLFFRKSSYNLENSFLNKHPTTGSFIYCNLSLALFFEFSDDLVFMNVSAETLMLVYPSFSLDKVCIDKNVVKIILCETSGRVLLPPASLRLPPEYNGLPPDYGICLQVTMVLPPDYDICLQTTTVLPPDHDRFARR